MPDNIAEIGEDLNLAADLLRAGELVGLPTETVYGLAGNALDASAVASIFRVKERPSFDPLIMHLPSLDRVADYVEEIPKLAHRLAQAFWPGPLTMVFKRKAIVPDLVTSGLDTVAIRVPAHPLAQQLLAKVDFPLAAPSANPFGYISPTRAEHVRRQLGGKIKYIIDGGPCPVGLESTIISFAGPEPVLLRKGGLTLEAIEQCIGRPIEVNTHGSSNPQAPGMLAKHYSPATKFVLLKDMPIGGSIASSPTIPLHKKALLTCGPMDEMDIDVFNLSPTGDLTEAAGKLFATLREIDESGYELIIATLVAEKGLGLAINDRLRRAAAR